MHQIIAFTITFLRIQVKLILFYLLTKVWYSICCFSDWIKHRFFPFDPLWFWRNGCVLKMKAMCQISTFIETSRKPMFFICQLWFCFSVFKLQVYITMMILSWYFFFVIWISEWMACHWRTAESWVGSLCHPPPWASHHALQEASQLSTAAAGEPSLSAELVSKVLNIIGLMF